MRQNESTRTIINRSKILFTFAVSALLLLIKIFLRHSIYFSFIDIWSHNKNLCSKEFTVVWHYPQRQLPLLIQNRISWETTTPVNRSAWEVSTIRPCFPAFRLRFERHFLQCDCARLKHNLTLTVDPFCFRRGLKEQYIQDIGHCIR